MVEAVLETAVCEVAAVMMRPAIAGRGLAVLVGAAAAAALFAITPKFEGTVLRTYRDLGGVLTYCTGATENAMWGKTYTPEECRAQLDRDLTRHAEGISKCIDLGKLTDGVFFQGGGSFFTIWSPKELYKMTTGWEGAQAACRAMEADAKGRKA